MSDGLKNETTIESWTIRMVILAEETGPHTEARPLPSNHILANDFLMSRNRMPMHADKRCICAS